MTAFRDYLEAQLQTAKARKDHRATAGTLAVLHLANKGAREARAQADAIGRREDAVVRQQVRKARR